MKGGREGGKREGGRGEEGGEGQGDEGREGGRYGEMRNKGHG